MRRSASVGSDSVRPLHPVGAHRHRDVRAIVDHELRPVPSRRLPERSRRRQQVPSVEILLPELHGAKPRAQAFLDDDRKWPRRRCTIRDEVEREVEHCPDQPPLERRLGRRNYGFGGGSEGAVEAPFD